MAKRNHNPEEAGYREANKLSICSQCGCDLVTLHINGNGSRYLCAVEGKPVYDAVGDRIGEEYTYHPAKAHDCADLSWAEKWKPTYFGEMYGK